MTKLAEVDELRQGERIRWVPGFEGGYAVTDQGRVFSFRCRWQPYKEMSPWSVNSKGDYNYQCVTLNPEGGKKHKLVHRLVLLAFVGEPEEGQECRHLNGDETDNRLDNLCWGSRQANKADITRHGNGKLLPEDAVAIRQKYATGDYTQKELAEEYGVAQNHISNIVRGVKWPDAGGPISTSNRTKNSSKIGKESKLTMAQARTIRRRYDEEYVTQDDLGDEYGVSGSLIGQIVRGEKYKES